MTPNVIEDLLLLLITDRKIGHPEGHLPLLPVAKVMLRSGSYWRSFLLASCCSNYETKD